MPPSVSFSTLAAIAVGGAAGAVSRHLVNLVALAAAPACPPLGTLVANLAGCYAVGALMTLARMDGISELQRQLWVTGFLGALTTFSAFGWQTLELGRQRSPMWAGINVAANLLPGLAAVALGAWTVQWWSKS